MTSEERRQRQRKITVEKTSHQDVEDPTINAQRENRLIYTIHGAQQ